MTLKATMYGPGFPEAGRRLRGTLENSTEVQDLLTQGVHVVELEAGGSLTYRGGDGSPFSFKVDEERPARTSVARRLR